MQGGWQPPPGGGGYGPPGGGYGAPPPGGGPPGYGGAPPAQGFAPNPYAAAPPPMMGGMNPQYGNYEFNEYENSQIDRAASRMKLWGVISTVLGSLELLGSCGMFVDPKYALNLPTGIVAIVVGITFMGAGNSLKSVVTTQGNDMMHLMQAMQKMSTAFLIEIICSIVGFVLYAIIALLVAFVFVAVAAANS